MNPAIPQDFGFEAQQVYKHPAKGFQGLYKHPALPLMVGVRCFVEIPGGRVSVVVVGLNEDFTKALVVDSEGYPIMADPYDLTLKCGRWQCNEDATSGPNIHHHNWRYCEHCRRRIVVDIEKGPGFGILLDGKYVSNDVNNPTKDITKAKVWRTPHRADRAITSDLQKVVMLVGLE